MRRSTAELFTRYRRETGQTTLVESLRVTWWMLQYTLGIVDAPRVATLALKTYTGKNEAELREECERWFCSHVAPHVTEHGRATVKRHQERGDLVAVVTGTTRFAAEPLARALGIEYIVCTELEVDANGCFTGRIVTPLSFGAGKVERVEALAVRCGFEIEDATFFSDSITDLPLFERVRHRVVVNPDARLRRVARRRGWTVERW